MEIVESAYTSLRAIGKDERWLHRWIVEKPSRLGLGELSIERSELSQYKNAGGRLDVLAYRTDLDTYYEIEVMLGECDADHGFRTLDSWARERLRNPNARHVAVLVAEDLSGRYQTVVETLSQFLPFIGIEIKVLKLPYQEGVATIVTSIVAQPDDLAIDAGDEPGKAKQAATAPRDRAWWESNASAAFMATVDEIAKYCTQDIGPSRVDYSAQSYVSLKKGRRCWLPMWPRANGTYVYLPGGASGSEAPHPTSTTKCKRNSKPSASRRRRGTISITAGRTRSDSRSRTRRLRTRWSARSTGALTSRRDRVTSDSKLSRGPETHIQAAACVVKASWT